MDLAFRDITYCKNVGAKRADILRSELGVHTALDMLRQYPYKYIDRSRFYKIAELDDEDTYVQIIGEVTEWHTIGIGKAQRLSATFFDGTHQCELVWFRGVQYVKLQRGVKYLLFGKPSQFNHIYNFVHPELTPWDKVTPEMTQGLEPYYNTTDKMKRIGLNSKAMRTIIADLIPDLKAGIPDTIGGDVLQRYRLMSLTEALLNVHFPRDARFMQNARARLKFEELFYIQLQLLRQQKRREQNLGFLMQSVGSRFHALYKSLPFDLTNAQKRVIREIHEDLKSGHQMNRLLQGDVGSGKTLVALFCCLLAVDNGYQTCIMAPTEILANQHYETLKTFLAPLGDTIRIELLTGSTTKKQREPLHANLRNGKVDILIGTHALLEDEVQWQRLGLVIVDEQHRFGVAQRAKLWNKGPNGEMAYPHILVMTATPIPRTLAMTLYGDLHVSTIDELPPGRKPVQTYLVKEGNEHNAYEAVRKELEKGHQAYFVYPAIGADDTEAGMRFKSAEKNFEALKKLFPEYKCALVHSKIDEEQQAKSLSDFHDGKLQILVATTVIEVGVDVPNATCMVIEQADHFGMAQLHQLRGRVGRGKDQSYCFLIYNKNLSETGIERMKALRQSTDGFYIAEQDLKTRGPGELQGTAQAGELAFSVADISRDRELLLQARTDAFSAFSNAYAAR